MKRFEIWCVKKEKSSGIISGLNRLNFTDVETHLEAMKAHFRWCNAIFYYENWDKEYNVYTYQDQSGLNTSYIFSFVPGEEDFHAVYERISGKYLANKKEKKCDCGSEKVFGKTGAHSHWCSLTQ